ncbi:MAG TPA: hypothetical protein VEZ40_03390 [Pyrinomonadaceae bacterium]|nr:hypothetical protein [Pyrinomonadaceae bacterium]
MKISRPARVILTGLLMLCAVVATTAQQAEDYPANWCRNGLFPSDDAEFKLAKVGGNWTARVHFFNDDDDCPSYTVKCETKRYLITGDEVVVSRKYGKWICGWYQKGKGGETVGWLPADKLVIPTTPAAPPILKDWIGVWKYDGKSLTIRRDGKTDSLKVKGYGIWEGTGANAHVGGVEAVARPQGNELGLVEEECRVSLKLVGDYLVARDNSECGGVNVRFNGVFRKARR